MPVRIVRLGAPREKNEGLRIGTVRRLPRGVPKTEYASRDYFDVWLPNLAPSEEIVKWALSEPWTEKRWATFARRYRAEMGRPEQRHLLETLAALARDASFSVGCYCEDEELCHRRVLRELLEENGATVR
jgi:uncharacterized protein YeaO (DUF488 family)